MKRTLIRVLITSTTLIALAVVVNVVEDSKLLSKMLRIHAMSVDSGLALLWFILGCVFIYQSARLVRRVFEKSRQSIKMAMLVNRLYSAVGYVFVAIVALHLVHIKVGSILVGGALTGVVVGIGAQSTLSNFFAGMILFTLRPVSIGQTVVIRTYLFGGVEYSGVVEDINWYHTILVDGNQRRVLPNSSIIVSAITVVSDHLARVFVVPIPYHVAIHQLKRDLEQRCDAEVRVFVRTYDETSYKAEIQLPLLCDVDVVRDVIHQYNASLPSS